MKSKIFFCSFLLLISLVACNKNAKRYNNTTTINPELIGTWTSTDGCYLQLAKENGALILINYHDGKNNNLSTIKLNFKMYSIATELTNKNPKDPKFNAKYIDGAIIINNICQPLQKIQ